MKKLSDYTLNPDNPRTISKTAFDKPKKSLTEFSKMLKYRPIVVNADGVIRGGNQRFLALQALGYDEVPDEWIVCADDLTPEEEQRFVVADNLPFGEWDFDLLAAQFDADELVGFGFDEGELTGFDSDKTLYSVKIKSPVYVPTGAKPGINELFDRQKTNQLVDEIEKSTDITKDEKEFLKAAAQRHTVLHFRNIAEYYAQS